MRFSCGSHRYDGERVLVRAEIAVRGSWRTLGEARENDVEKQN